MEATFWRILFNKSLLRNNRILLVTNGYYWLLHLLTTTSTTINIFGFYDWLIYLLTRTESYNWLQPTAYTYTVHSIFHLPHDLQIKGPEMEPTFWRNLSKLNLHSTIGYYITFWLQLITTADY